MSSINCCFLTCTQISQEAGQVVRYSHLFQNFPQFIVIHTVKGLGIVNKAEIDVFLELFCFFDDPSNVGNLISGSSAFSKTILNTWKFTVHILLKPGLENFENYFTSVWDECNCEETREKQSKETIVQPWPRVPVLPQGTHITISLSCFANTAIPTRWEKLAIWYPQAWRPQTFGIGRLMILTPTNPTTD